MNGDYGDARTCPACAYQRVTLVKEARKNERRLRTGKPPVFREIRLAKQAIADCAARGHHDVMAGPNAAHSTA